MLRHHTWQWFPNYLGLNLSHSNAHLYQARVLKAGNESVLVVHIGRTCQDLRVNPDHGTRSIREELVKESSLLG